MRPRLFYLELPSRNLASTGAASDPSQPARVADNEVLGGQLLPRVEKQPIPMVLRLEDPRLVVQAVAAAAALPAVLRCCCWRGHDGGRLDDGAQVLGRLVLLLRPHGDGEGEGRGERAEPPAGYRAQTPSW